MATDNSMAVAKTGGKNFEKANGRGFSWCGSST